MKNLRAIILFFAVVLLFIGNTYAANITFDITTGYFTGDNSITFDLSCTTDTDVEVKGYLFDFKYDQNELFFVSHENLGQSVFSSGYDLVSGYGEFSNERDEGTLKNFSVRAARGVLLETLEQGTSKLGSFTFSLTENSIGDGLTDFSMVAVRYMSITENSTIISSTNALGAVSLDGSFGFMQDVGASSVPVPAAVWLLGSGLVGLAGFRRKKA